MEDVGKLISKMKMMNGINMKMVMVRANNSPQATLMEILTVASVKIR